MAEYSIEDIVKDVRILIDENEDNERLIAEDDEVANNTDTISKAMIIHSIDQVHLIAPLWRVAEISVETTVDLSDKRGAIPEYYLRYVYAKADDWAYKVFEPIDQESDEYKMQFSEFEGIKGSAEKPVVAIVPDQLQKSGLGIEVYSTEENTISLVYVKKASAETDAELKISILCYQAVLNMIAKNYMINVNEPDRAKYYDAMVMESLGISTE